MKIHTTNYFDALIEVAEDSKANVGTKPTAKKEKTTTAIMQYEMIAKNPYKYSSDDVIFQVFAARKDLTQSQ